MSPTTAAAAALGAALTLLAPAARAGGAAPANPALTRSVSIADLDVGKPADVAALKRRLHTAAVELCLTATAELVLAEQQAAYSQCVSSAGDQALRDADVTIARRTTTPTQAYALR